MTLSLTKSDKIGIISSSLCLLHCLATPILFAVQTQIVDNNNSKSLWWSSLDIVFLIISFFAIYKTANTTANKWIKIGLWVNWCLLITVIINEKLMWFNVPEFFIYVPSLGLIFIHIYNSKYCRCDNKECCANKVLSNGKN